MRNLPIESARLIASLARLVGDVDLAEDLAQDALLAALEIVDRLLDEPALAHYHLLPSARGALLFRLGRKAEAAAEFKRAASLTRNDRDQTLLLKRATAATQLE